MPIDLPARIRDVLDNPKQYAENGNGPLIEALLAVVDMHDRISNDWTHFHETSEELARRWAIEQAVELIAERLGIDP
jgi:hypothetical protein